VFDFLVKGLAELGHVVLYYLESGVTEPLPLTVHENVTFVDRLIMDADVYHVRSDSTLPVELEALRKPWVATCHVDLEVHGQSRADARPNWIYVSRHLAHTYNSCRFVRNGIDPAELDYCEEKEDYLLFVCALPLARRKGLDKAIWMARQSGRPLYIAGSADDQALVDEIRRHCKRHQVFYVGEIHGKRKARIFAKASALLFPTQLNEAFGLVLAEAMFSGTPVICSDQGACTELVSSSIGFVCTSDDEYLEAVEKLDTISPLACRETAMRNYHYSRMAQDYLNEYKVEML
jgi:glycosyltransferase involved in cell wall biosynthesis